MSETRTISLHREDGDQTIRIPEDLELPGDEAVIHKEGDRLVIEPKTQKKTLREVLDSLEPFPDFPDIDDSDLLPLRDIVLE